jgi:hypothetical protein
MLKKKIMLCGMLRVTAKNKKAVREVISEQLFSTLELCSMN